MGDEVAAQRPALPIQRPRRPPRFTSPSHCAPANCRGSARVGWRDPEPHGCGDGAYTDVLAACPDNPPAPTPPGQCAGQMLWLWLWLWLWISGDGNRRGRGRGRGRGDGSRAWLGSTPGCSFLAPGTALGNAASQKRQKPGQGRAFAVLPAGSRRIPRQARWISAWRTGWRDVPCAGRPSYARLRGRHGS
jgi:hypothetical protein